MLHGVEEFVSQYALYVYGFYILGRYFRQILVWAKQNYCECAVRDSERDFVLGLVPCSHCRRFSDTCTSSCWCVGGSSLLCVVVVDPRVSMVGCVCSCLVM